MATLNEAAFLQFINQEIEIFHNRRLERLSKLKLTDFLKRKNPYLFKAKNLNNPEDLLEEILTAYLSSSEEELFGRFLEMIAIYVSADVTNGHKSSAEGIDLEFQRDKVYYLVSIKSGPNWGNNSQKKRLENNFKTAIRVQQQASKGLNVQAVLGICYGKVRSTHTGLYWKYVGQSFWHFISENPNLYIDLIEPIGYQAREHTAIFHQKRQFLKEQILEEFIVDFCQPNGQVDWQKLVEFNSGNLE